MKMALTALGLALGLALSAPAHAASIEDAPAVADCDEELIDTGETTTDGRRVMRRRVERVDFTQVKVGGDMVRPEGTLINERPPASPRILITLRQDFNPEMAESVNSVR